MFWTIGLAYTQFAGKTAADLRQALLAATPGSTTVAAEALRWGFWHFSEFARAYNDCFGELPSDTLLRIRE